LWEISLLSGQHLFLWNLFYKTYQANKKKRSKTKNQLFVNVLLSEGDVLGISYCEGQYDEMAKATIRQINTIKGQQINFTFTFTIDWNYSVLNGTIKDDVHRMRVFKAFKL
jgi:hypothetical protein